MQVIQDLVHKLEVGGGMRYLRIGLAALALVGVTVLYNFRSFKNLSTRDAMDAAQLGRNLAEGKGYTTYFVRPFSMYLLRQHNQLSPSALDTSKPSDPARIKDRHPDLANAPLYPVVLAGLLKIMPFDYSVELSKPFWSSAGRLWRYPPDFWIGMFNQLIFFAVIVLVFFLARRLFDPRVAWLSAMLLFGTELMWRFSVSGLSTMLLLLIFMGLIWCVAAIEQEAREPAGGKSRLILLAILAGLLTGAGCLTRYSFGWLILPVILFLVLFGGPRRVVLGGLALAAFACLLIPWVVRNYQVSGTPLGIAGYAIMEGTGALPGDRLERSLSPDFSTINIFSAITFKLLANTRHILTEELPTLGGTWLSAFFIVGLFIPFRDAPARRLRYFLLASLAVLVVVQALGQTELSQASRVINSENLLVLAAPLALVYGVSFFFLVLDQLELPVRELRYVVVGIFSAAVCLPMLFTFLPPRTIPVAYPPYYPPSFSYLAGWMRENDLALSDLPWAVAWYGRRQCLWLPPTPADVIEINDYQKPVQALFLSRVTLDGKFVSDWLQGSEARWADLVLQAIGRPSNVEPGRARPVNIIARGGGNEPSSFPLHYWQSGWPEHFILTAVENPIKASP